MGNIMTTQIMLFHKQNNNNVGSNIFIELLAQLFGSHQGQIKRKKKNYG